MKLPEELACRLAGERARRRSVAPVLSWPSRDVPKTKVLLSASLSLCPPDADKPDSAAAFESRPAIPPFTKTQCL